MLHFFQTYFYLVLKSNRNREARYVFEKTWEGPWRSWTKADDWADCWWRACLNQLSWHCCYIAHAADAPALSEACNLWITGGGMFCKLLANESFFNFCVQSCRTISGTWTLLRNPQILSALLSVCLQKLQLLLLLLLLAVAMAGHTPRVSAAQLGLRRVVSSAPWWRHQSALFFFSFILTCSRVRRRRVQHSSAGITGSNGMHTFVSVPSLLTDPAQSAQLRAQRDEISFN